MHEVLQQGFSGLNSYIINLFSEMPPGISRLLKLQPVVALISGLVNIFLIKKGFNYVPIIIVFIVFTSFYLTFRLYTFKEKSGVIAKVTDIAVMFFINNMILFILPFYFGSMTFPSRNIAFGFIIIGLAVISNWYYVFEKLVKRSIFGSSIYYALIFFCVLNFIFPIIFGMRNIWSLTLSGSIAAIIAILLFFPRDRRWKNWLKFASGILLSLVFLWFGRSFIPPAPLKLLYATACENIAEHSPVMPFEMNNMESSPEIFFYSAIFAPKGLSEKIDHKWYHNGRELFFVNLSEIRGGRMDGYRTWSKHTIVEGPGEYTIEVWTDGNQLLGEGSFVLK
jgi:hypothetical protein